MAADQRRKRLNGAAIVGFSSREHHKMKKRKLDSSDNSLKSRAHVSLEWDGSGQRVVAKKNQIGLSSRHLRSFANYISHRNNFLADVCVVPQEIFHLKNLTDVLSCEVWQSHLSEPERNSLRQFLPDETEKEQVVEALLTGQNLHFGNPSLEWGTAVCSGNLHPDAVAGQEQHLKDDKRAYYSELQKYHHDIIDHLQGLKGIWESCKDSEKETLLKMWGSSRRDSTHAIEGNWDLEQDLTAASESCSWNDADEEPCSSDYQNSSPLMGGERKKRILEKTGVNENYGNPSISRAIMQNVGTKARKRVILQKHAQHTDGAEYMSYLKISKQHQIVTSMKQSGKSIQSKPFNRSLGSINKLDVQPYEVFVEEERKKLHLHWLQLVKDIPVARAFWKDLQLRKLEIIKCLESDLRDKLEPSMKAELKQDAKNILQTDDTGSRLGVGTYLADESDAKVMHESLVHNQNVIEETDYKPYFEESEDSGDGSAQHKSSPLQPSSPHDGLDLELKDGEDDADSDPDSPPLQSSPGVSSLNGSHDAVAEDVEDKPSSDPSSTQDLEDVACVVPSFLQDQTLKEVPAISGANTVMLNDNVYINKHGVSKLENVPFFMAEQLRRENDAAIASSCGGPFSSARDIRPAVGTGSYIESTSSRQAYTSNYRGLPCADPRGNGERLTSFSLESNMDGEDGRKNTLQVQSNNGSFGLFTNKDRNGLLQSLLRNPGLSSNSQEQLQSLLVGMSSHDQDLGFQPPNSVAVEGIQLSNHVQKQTQSLHPISQERKRPIEIYMQDNTSENVYCNGIRYLIPGPAGAQDWNIGHMRLPVPTQSRINSSEILKRNCLIGENQLQSMWSGSNGAGVTTDHGIQSDQSLTRGSNSDQTLFSVLSQCNPLQSKRPSDPASSTEQQFITPKNYGLMMNAGISRISCSLPTAALPLDYMFGGNSTPPLMPDETGWINPVNQNSARHDHPRKLYPGSLNQ